MNDIETCSLQTVLQVTPAVQVTPVVQVGATVKDAAQKRKAPSKWGFSWAPHPGLHLYQSHSRAFCFLFSVFAFHFL